MVWGFAFLDELFLYLFAYPRLSLKNDNSWIWEAAKKKKKNEWKEVYEGTKQKLQEKLNRVSRKCKGKAEIEKSRDRLLKVEWKIAWKVSKYYKCKNWASNDLSCWLSFSKLALMWNPLGLWHSSGFTIDQDILPSSRPKVWFSVLTPRGVKTTLRKRKLITSSNAQTIMAVVQPLVLKYRNKMSMTLCIQTLSLLMTKDKTSVLLLE